MSLLVLGVLTYHVDDTPAPNDLVPRAAALDACLHLHTYRRLCGCSRRRSLALVAWCPPHRRAASAALVPPQAKDRASPLLRTTLPAREASPFQTFPLGVSCRTWSAPVPDPQRGRPSVPAGHVPPEGCRLSLRHPVAPSLVCLAISGAGSSFLRQIRCQTAYALPHAVGLGRITSP